MQIQAIDRICTVCGFFFSYQQGPDRGGRRAMEEIERKKKCAKRKRDRLAVERERVSINFFRLRNKYIMY